MLISQWLFYSLIGGSVVGLLASLALWSGRTQRSIRVCPSCTPHQELADSLVPVEALTRGWLTEDNAVEVLQNGDEFFGRLLEDIASAEHSIHLETYVWWKGDICERMAEALAARAREGVEVRLMLDAVGSLTMDDALYEAMEEAGVHIVKYHDFRLRTFGRLNKRNHRKTAVLDGRIAYAFGQGIAAEWEGDGEDKDHWRDTGVRIRGRAVAHVQSAFAQNWMEESKEVLSDPDYFPEVDAHPGGAKVQVVPSSPRGGVSSVALLYRLMIVSASRELYVQNPYFVPGADVIELLLAAVERGVAVRIMVPGIHNDSAFVRHAGHFVYEKLMAGGVEIWEFTDGMIHQKILIVDGCWSHVGSTNFDERSFDINAEISVGIFDETVASELTAAWDRDLERCEKIHMHRWKKRGRFHQLADRLAYQLHEQL